ncbi:MAG: hypothetical protein ACFFFT_00030 [Candidatus Thorarchaeota archaeon]
MNKSSPCEDITLGFLLENKIHSKEDLINYLNENKIHDEKTRELCITEYEKWLTVRSYMAEVAKNYISPIKPLFDALDFISTPVKKIKPITKTLEILRPISVALESISSFLKKESETEWYKNVNNKYKDLKNFYLPRLIKSHRIFKENIYKYYKDQNKKLITFSELYLYLCSIFENFSVKLVKTFKNESALVKDRIYRRDLNRDMRRYMDVIQINFYHFFHFLNKIVDNIKHNDKKFYKRYDKFSKNKLLEEANDIYLGLKFYIKHSLANSYILQIKLSYF